VEQELNNSESNDAESNDADMQEADLRRQVECLQADYYSCEEAVRRLNEYLDHQLTEAERVVVLKHLEICRPCLKRFSFEQTLVISLRQRVLHLCAPAALREKLHSLLREKE
jgi:anti-sigma factor (TIGR02949 family)